MTSTKSKLARDVPPTIDLRPSANAFQASLVLIASLIGALIGFQIVANGRWIAAACGGIVGIIAATFVSGFLLMFLPQAIPHIEIQASIHRYQNLRRRLTVLAWCYVVWGAIAIGWLAIELPTNDWLIAIWLLLMLICYAVLGHTARLLDLWRCPACDQMFGRRASFERYPHCCRNCGFTVP
ncbi:hypothetical protein Pla175_41690 [Pirellulimonas nuda]|uniref:Uncharacterized protein n=1 Tax=Pirellulimonas nuda TaxID=2528009 RepID=A0A518DH09_9BACT|nr:hypothetical protein [Pirellulimonas nuda]QDU90757.1 hypothetical protein Pla175_41690 [Pirellulimonas nuda]